MGNSIRGKTLFCLLFLFHCAFAQSSQSSEPVSVPVIVNEAILSLREKKTPIEKWCIKDQLNVFLVEDKWATETNIGLLIETGTAYQKAHEAGIAHLIQHIISSKSNSTFPEGTSLSDFTLQFGGSFSAWTGYGATGFVLSIPFYRLKGALQRLKAMLQSPYFLTSDLIEEAEHVREEFEINLEEDNHFRSWIALTEMCNPQHPLFQSTWENVEQLSTIAPDTIKNWFKENYPTSKMHLVIISPESLASLRSNVLPLLEDINLSGLVKKAKPPSLFLENTFAWVPSFHNERSLFLAFPLKEEGPDSQRKELFITTFLKDERKNSPQNLLKETGFIEHLNAYFETENSSLQSLFLVEIDLTPLGVHHWQQVVSEIFASILEIGKRSDVGAFLAHEKIVQQFIYAYPKYSPPQQKTFILLKQMLSEPFKTFPQLSYQAQSFDFNPAEITKNLLNTPKGVILSCPSHEWFSFTNDVPAKPASEKDFLARPFRTIPLFTCPLPKLPIPQVGNFLDIPNSNAFLPREILQPTLEKYSDNLSFYPEVFQNAREHRAAFIQERCFGEPREIWQIRLSHPSMISSLPYDRALFLLTAEVLQQKIKTISLEAKAAEAEISLKQDRYSLDFLICGWMKYIDTMMQQLLKEIKLPLDLTEDEFQKIKTSLFAKIASSEQSLLHTSLEILRDQICEPSISKAESLEALFSITLEECQTFYEDFKENSYPQGVFIGKNKKSPIPIWEAVANCFKSNRPFTPQIVSRLHTGLHKVEVSGAPFSSVLIAVDFGNLESVHGYTLASLLAMGLNQPFQSYQKLNREIERSQVSLQETAGHIFLTFHLQSSNNTCEFLQVQIEEFIQEFCKNFEMPPFFHYEKFKNLKSELAIRASMPSVNLQSWAHQLYDLSMDRLSWKFWNNVSEHSREIEYRSFKSYSSAILNLQATRAFCIAMKGVHESK